jgi:hypothetical protein
MNGDVLALLLGRLLGALAITYVVAAVIRYFAFERSSAAQAGKWPFIISVCVLAPLNYMGDGVGAALIVMTAGAIWTLIYSAPHLPDDPARSTSAATQVSEPGPE